MKTNFLILFAFLLFHVADSQELMTIGEVFDFEAGDEFQTRSTANYQPPNADRITVTGKHYSENHDTVFYNLYHDMYYTTVVWEGEPFLEYHFGIFNNTVFYTDLDSSLLLYDFGFSINQYFENSTQLCDSLINGCAYSWGPGFEDDYIIHDYGRGLGMTYEYHYSGMGGYELSKNTLFYYKKGIEICGTPDMTSVGTQFHSLEQELTVFPNPAGKNIFLKGYFDEADCTVLNAMGQPVMWKTLIMNDNSLDIDQLPAGLYFLLVQTNNNPIMLKFIKN